MAVLIDMEMPQNCAECRFRSDGWCYCIPEDARQPTETRTDCRPSWCPLVEIQTPRRIMPGAALEAAGFEL